MKTFCFTQKNREEKKLSDKRREHGLCKLINELNIDVIFSRHTYTNKSNESGKKKYKCSMFVCKNISNHIFRSIEMFILIINSCCNVSECVRIRFLSIYA